MIDHVRLARLHGSTNAASLGYQLLIPAPPTVVLNFE